MESTDERIETLRAALEEIRDAQLIAQDGQLLYQERLEMLVGHQKSVALVALSDDDARRAE